MRNFEMQTKKNTTNIYLAALKSSSSNERYRQVKDHEQGQQSIEREQPGDSLEQINKKRSPNKYLQGIYDHNNKTEPLHSNKSNDQFTYNDSQQSFPKEQTMNNSDLALSNNNYFMQNKVSYTDSFVLGNKPRRLSKSGRDPGKHIKVQKEGAGNAHPSPRSRPKVSGTKFIQQKNSRSDIKSPTQYDSNQQSAESSSRPTENISRPIESTGRRKRKLNSPYPPKTDKTEQIQVDKQNDEIEGYKQILDQHGIQIHPKQMGMLYDNNVQQMLQSKQSSISDTKINQVIQEASRMQVGINEQILNIRKQDTRNNSSSNSNSNKHYQRKRNPLSPDYEGPNGNKNTIGSGTEPSEQQTNINTQQKRNQEFNDIIQSNLHDNLAEKIAKEITPITRTTPPKNPNGADRPVQFQDATINKGNAGATPQWTHQVSPQVNPKVRSHKRDTEHNETDAQLADVITEKMKSMSVYDLYQIANSQDNTVIDLFIKQQLLSNINTSNQSKQQTQSVFSQSSQQPQQPQQAQDEYQMPKQNRHSYIDHKQRQKNIQIDIENIIDKAKKKNYNSSNRHHSNQYLSNLQPQSSVFLKHLKNQASIILETQDEHIYSKSLEQSQTASPDVSKHSTQKLQAGQEKVLLDDQLLEENFKGEQMTYDQRDSQRTPLECRRGDSPLAGETLDAAGNRKLSKSPSKNQKYYKSINQRYVDSPHRNTYLTPSMRSAKGHLSKQNEGNAFQNQKSKNYSQSNPKNRRSDQLKKSNFVSNRGSVVEGYNAGLLDQEKIEQPANTKQLEIKTDDFPVCDEPPGRNPFTEEALVEQTESKDKLIDDQYQTFGERKASRARQNFNEFSTHFRDRAERKRPHSGQRTATRATKQMKQHTISMPTLKPKATENEDQEHQQPNEARAQLRASVADLKDNLEKNLFYHKKLSSPQPIRLQRLQKKYEDSKANPLARAEKDFLQIGRRQMKAETEGGSSANVSGREKERKARSKDVRLETKKFENTSKSLAKTKHQKSQSNIDLILFDKINQIQEDIQRTSQQNAYEDISSQNQFDRLVNQRLNTPSRYDNKSQGEQCDKQLLARRTTQSNNPSTNYSQVIPTKQAAKTEITSLNDKRKKKISKSSSKYSKVESRLKSTGKLHKAETMTIKQYLQKAEQDKPQLAEPEIAATSPYEEETPVETENEPRDNQLAPQQQFRQKSKSPNSPANQYAEQSGLQRITEFLGQQRPRSSNQQPLGAQKQNLSSFITNVKRVSYKDNQKK